jgi:hypothetical protein
MSNQPMESRAVLGPDCVIRFRAEDGPALQQIQP